jgi:hypothetical protein
MAAAEVTVDVFVNAMRVEALVKLIRLRTGQDQQAMTIETKPAEGGGLLYAVRWNYDGGEAPNAWQPSLSEACDVAIANIREALEQEAAHASASAAEAGQRLTDAIDLIAGVEE